MEDILLGTTDRSITVFIADPASTDGSGKTGLTHADFTVSYTRVETDNDVVVTDVTSSLTTLTNLTDAHTDWGLKEVSSTLAPGLYRLDIADAVFASGAWEAVVYVMLTSSAAVATPKKFRLVAFNVLDSVRMGLTALPNAAAEAAGGLYTRGTGAGQINQPANGMIDTNVVRWLGSAAAAVDVTGYPVVTVKTDTIVAANVTHVLGEGLTETTPGNISGSVSHFFDKATPTGTVNSLPDALPDATGGVAIVGSEMNLATDAIKNTTIENNAISAAKFALGAIDANALAADAASEIRTGLATSSALADLHTDVGNVYSRLGAPAGASMSADIAAVKTDTGNLVTRIPAALFSGITSLAQWLGLIAGKQVGDTTARTELRATGAGSGTFDETTDSLEAIQDSGSGSGSTPTQLWALAGADPSEIPSATASRGEKLDAVYNALVAGATINQTTVTQKNMAGATIGTRAISKSAGVITKENME